MALLKSSLLVQDSQMSMREDDIIKRGSINSLPDLEKSRIYKQSRLPQIKTLQTPGSAPPMFKPNKFPRKTHAYRTSITHRNRNIFSKCMTPNAKPTKPDANLPELCANSCKLYSKKNELLDYKIEPQMVVDPKESVTSTREENTLINVAHANATNYKTNACGTEVNLLEIFESPTPRLKDQFIMKWLHSDGKRSPYLDEFEDSIYSKNDATGTISVLNPTIK
ncbi:uncharacterized protein LOC117122271 [Anneissia japonica]|uniref:uncharacterized protein LOC117122271 n=1 Tax=Anneissia japonica TaxID=1529436 RepID=UPI0014255BD4|nr:uncharacterized protein LOC117122271 [Anneissia japonica]